MNLFEFSAFAGFLGGAVVGATLGATVGAPIAGGLGGAVGGFILAPTSLGAVFAAGIVYDRFDKRALLRHRFGRYWRNAHRASWEEAKRHIVIGSVMHGEVVAERRYGRFLDIGHGFPATLRSVDGLGLVPDLPATGSRLDVLVTGFDDAEREILLIRPERVSLRT